MAVLRKKVFDQYGCMAITIKYKAIWLYGHMALWGRRLILLVLMILLHTRHNLIDCLKPDRMPAPS